MNRALLSAMVASLVWLSASVARSNEEICVACDQKVLISGDVNHRRAWGVTTIVGAGWRGEEAFREEIYGTNFTLSVSGLPAGKYVSVIGFVEVDFTNAGQRVFDITCGKQVLANNLDIYAAAGGAGIVHYLTNTVDQAGDSIGGQLSLTFTGKTDAAKFNSFELEDASGLSLIFVRAADLISAEDTALLELPVVAGPEIWKDAAQPVAARVHDLVRRMSLAEKIQADAQRGAGDSAAGHSGLQLLERMSARRRARRHGHGFPAGHRHGGDVGHAVDSRRRRTSSPPRRAPSTTITSATHDGDSAQYYGLTFWTPNINIFRDPRWGRGQETYGEDPFLTARLGVAFIRGLQGDDPNYIKAMACAKHFAVHSGPEPERHRFDAEPPERDFYETYLPQFEAAVREGHVGAVMGAYNSVYGKPACANPLLLTDLLRQQWGFDGHVVSDCGAIYDIFAQSQIRRHAGGSRRATR